MKLLPYSVFLGINIILGIALTTSLFIDSDYTNARYALVASGIAFIIVTALSKEKPFAQFSIIPTRIVALIVFIEALLLAFTPYLLQFTDSPTLVWLTVVVSGVSLLSIIFSNLTLSETQD